MKKILGDTQKDDILSQTEERMTRTCTWCYNKFELEDMTDDLSRKEALISGFCQECQDKTFK